MESIRSLFRIGNGPSSSHTMGPRKAAQQFSSRTPGAARYVVTLYGSLAATGRGHLTDRAILDVLEPLASTEIIWKPDIFLPFHPNGMLFEAFDAQGALLDSWTIFSVGGGALANEESRSDENKTPSIYPLTKLHDIQHYCEEHGITYWEYVEKYEGPEIWDYLSKVWEAMKAAIERGLEAEGVLPGGLGLRRKAASYYVKAKGYNGSMQTRGMVYAYALATSEENASGGVIVTAPTCGSSGVVPAALYYLKQSRDFR
ncbi:L-serine ammonia-lyase, iron-sulfur-dependent, subunit alpha, partial [Alistipes sp. OttesenSCG-928-L06]|nr:L-serine ammonia-lyase, iron-sulfur-dependent, subunit alpha [Alistipes sp. OttesenSCG-928-L06]